MHCALPDADEASPPVRSGGGAFVMGNRFAALNITSRGFEKITGTVKYKRDMYGPANGGTYMVEWDSPKIKNTVDRNMFGINMFPADTPWDALSMR